MRNVVFTIFDEEWSHSRLDCDEIKSAAVQLEECPDTGRKHFQGYLQLKNPMRMAAIKTLLGCDSAHIEKCKGTPVQAWEYCTKESTRVDGPWTYGTKPRGQGTR